MQLRIIYNDFSLWVVVGGFFFFFSLVISGFLEGARSTFLCVLWVSAFLTVWCATRLFLPSLLRHLQLRLIMYAWYLLPSPSTPLLTLPSCLEIHCQLCLLGIGERRTPGRFAVCQFGKPKGKVPERIEKRIQERWEWRNGWAQKPAQEYKRCY